jgi:hypothetical protein
MDVGAVGAGIPRDSLPLYGYLYVPILLIARHVLAVYVLVLGLNSIAVVFIYRFGRDVGGTITGLVSAVLYLSSAWMIEYTRSTWSYSIMPFLLSVLAYAVWRALFGSERGRDKAYAIAMICTTLITLITLTGYFILPTLIFILLVFRRRVKWRLLLKWSPIFLLPTIIFAVAIFAQWQVFSTQSQSVLAASQGASLRTEPLLHAVRLATGAEYELLRGQDAPIRDSELRHNVSVALNTAIAILIVIGIVVTVVNLVSRRQSQYSLLLLWWFTPIALMSYNSALIHPFYLLVSTPVGFVLAGIGATVLINQSRYFVPIVASILVVNLGIQWVNSGRYYEETAILPSAHGFTALSLEYGLSFGSAIRDNLQDGTIVFSYVEEWILHSFAGRIFEVNRVENNVERMIVPQKGGLLVGLGATESTLVATIPVYERRLSDDTLIRLELVSPETWQPSDYVPHQVQGDVVSLLGYRLRGEGTSRQLDIYWRVEAVPADTSLLYSLSLHGYRGEERVFVADGKPIATYKWQLRDVLAQTATFDFDVNEQLTLRVGLFDGARGEGLAFSSENIANGMIVLSQPAGK